MLTVAFIRTPHCLDQLLRANVNTNCGHCPNAFLRPTLTKLNAKVSSVWWETPQSTRWWTQVRPSERKWTHDLRQFSSKVRLCLKLRIRTPIRAKLLRPDPHCLPPQIMVIHSTGSSTPPSHPQGYRLSRESTRPWDKIHRLRSQIWTPAYQSRSHHSRKTARKCQYCVFLRSRLNPKSRHERSRVSAAILLHYFTNQTFFQVA